jgi:sterol desaturase/sphingolipid hydroxylase (fatty acid hydroxylase superfamily)
MERIAFFYSSSYDAFALFYEKCTLYSSPIKSSNSLSVYSFHWLEAVLLSTVPLTIVLFLPLSFISIAIYPLTSILLNYSGHCNYRFGNGIKNSWKLFGTLHNEHHYKNKDNYGFVLQLFDHIISKFKTLK